MSEEIKETLDGEKEISVVAGFVLLKDANMDWPRFRHYLKEDWGIVPDDDVKDNILVFQQGDMKVACSLMPSPIPEHEAEENAKNNFLWKDGPNEVAKHGAHVMIAVMNKADALEQSKLFVKTAASMLKLKNAIGLYKNPTVYPKDFYTSFADGMKQGELPVPLMIYVGMYITKESLLCAFTKGMDYFGKNEIEIVDSFAQPNELYGFILSIAEYLLTSDDQLSDGDTIGFSENEKLPVQISDGVSVKGTTIKIGYKTK